MAEISKDKENIVSVMGRVSIGIYGFLIVFFTGLVLILAALTWKTTNDYPFRDHVIFSLGWIDENGNHVDISDINSNADIYKILPDTTETQTLFLGLKTGNMKAYIDGELIYENVLYETWFLGSTPGYMFAEIEIPAGSGGREIHLKFENPYNDHATRVHEIYFGNGISIISYKFYQFMMPFLLGSLTIVVGVIAIIMFFIFGKKFDNANKWIYIGVFAIVTGIFVLMDSKMLHLMYGHWAIWHIVIEICLMLIPIPIFLYILEEFRITKRLYPYIVVFISIVEIVFNFVLNVLNIKEYHEVVFLTHGVFGLVGVIGVFIAGTAVLKNFKQHIYDLVGIIIMMLGGLTDVIIYYTKNISQTYIFLRIGVFGFLIFSSIQVIVSLMNEYESTVKVDMVRKLAYHDGLTDLYNRTSFIEEMEKLDKNNGECVLVAMFDVNNLKSVNDTLGHTVGDDLILSEAKALSAGFNEVGKVFRTGGDEFVVIITGDLIRDKFEKGLEKYNEKVKETNRTQKCFTLSAAVGVDSNVISENCRMKDILDKADSTMYENKKEMKRVKNS